MDVDQYNLKLKTTLNPYNNMSTSFLTVTVPVFLVWVIFAYRNSTVQSKKAK